ncbi:MAG TPA: zinc ribbon domain-containing protein [Candidatus Bathyarchaeia archaeon]|nr:zinc ribbon domain-containing protein [Candidatus Bathyarchaeia archaeon]
MGDKPIAGTVLSILGGLCVLIGGLIQAFLGSFISSFGGALGSSSATNVGNIFSILGYLGIAFGALMIVGGIMMAVKPATHKMWGAIVLVLSIVSLATSSVGGFIFGFILGLIGGILGLVFKTHLAPSMMSAQPMGSMPLNTYGSNIANTGTPSGAFGSTCKSCGASIPAGASKCANCGASI